MSETQLLVDMENNGNPKGNCWRRFVQGVQWVGLKFIGICLSATFVVLCEQLVPRWCRRMLDSSPKYSHDLCIVTFSSCAYSSLMNETTLVRKVVQDLPERELSVTDFLVNNYECFNKLPKTQKYVVMVEKDDRDVILEKTDRGQGGLRVECVRHIMKRGEDTVLLIYYNHLSSQRLHDELYDRELKHVFLVDELNTLAKKNNFFSICLEFNDEQKNRLREWLPRGN